MGNLTYADLARRFRRWRARFRRHSIPYREEGETLNRHIGEFLRTHTWFRELEPDEQVHWLRGVKREVFRSFRSEKKKERQKKERSQRQKEDPDQGSLF